MPLGPLIRGLFGPYEANISDAWRSMFVSVDAFVQQTLAWVPSAQKILEVGCGEGAVAAVLRIAYPQAAIIGIDVTPQVGRLYTGNPDNIQFRNRTIQDFAACEAGRYDLVVLCDVLHHVPVDLRAEILVAVRQTLAPNGAFVVKDWERSRSPIHWFCYGSDRWITGDRVQYMSRDEMLDLLGAGFGPGSILAEARVAPWRNNMAALVRVHPGSCLGLT